MKAAHRIATEGVREWYILALCSTCKGTEVRTFVMGSVNYKEVWDCWNGSGKKGSWGGSGFCVPCMLRSLGFNPRILETIGGFSAVSASRRVLDKTC